jgi:Na+-driven multidrug efflux pump
VLCFGLGWQAVGIWTGLSLGLIFVAIVLLVAWRRSTRRMDIIISSSTTH